MARLDGSAVDHPPRASPRLLRLGQEPRMAVRPHHHAARRGGVHRAGAGRGRRSVHAGRALVWRGSGIDRGVGKPDPRARARPLRTDVFALVDAHSPPPNGADGIRNAVAAASAALDAGDRDAAAEHFIDFWMGAGSWKQTPGQRRPAIADSGVNVRRWSHALFTEPTPLAAFAALDVPVLYMVGKRSPESAHAVARLLLPCCRESNSSSSKASGTWRPSRTRSA